LKRFFVVPVLALFSVYFVKQNNAFSKTFVSLESTAFFTESSRKGQDDFYYDLSFGNFSDIKYKNLKGFYSIFADFTLNQIETSQLAIPYAYLYKKNNNHLFVLGRANVADYKFEDVWAISLIHPYYRKDFLSPKKQGIFGLHYGYKNKWLKLGVVLSPIFLPDQGPQVNEENGTLYASSRWFGGQISEIKLGSGSFTSVVKYKLDRPKLDDILFNPGVIFTGAAGLGNDSVFKALYAYKPMNQLHLAAFPVFDSSLGGDFNTLATISVDVPYHHLFVVGLEKEEKDYSLWLNLAHENVERPELDAKLLEANLEDTNFLILGGQYNISKNTSAILSYLVIDKSFLDDEPQVVVVGGNEANVNFNRHIYDEAILFKLRHKINNKLSTEVSYIYSIEEDGGVGSIDIGYENKHISCFAKLGVVGVNKEDPDAFFTSVRDNDFINIGAKYVF